MANMHVRIRRRQQLSHRRAFWRPAIEALEPRTVMALLGVSPGLPLVSYNSSGTGVSYNASTDQFALDSTPLALVPIAPFAAGSLQIRAEINASGILVGGVAGDDLVLTGTLAGPPFANPLLTGEVTAFGYADAGLTDQYDFRFTPTGGSLMSYFAGKDIGVTVTSEPVVGQPNFIADFSLDFGGGAKGSLGPIDKPIFDQPVYEGRIQITPDGINEVNHAHTFNTLVEVNDNLSAGAPNGDGVDGFRPATNDEVQSLAVQLLGVNGANPVISSPADPENDNLVSSGDNNLAVTFNSATAGVVAGFATAEVIVDGHTLNLQTDGANGNSTFAVKTYVDAQISINKDATNVVGQPHTFTVTVLENAGDGNGWVPAAGESVTVALANLNGASYTTADSLTGVTNASGQFQVTINSLSAGQVVANATSSIVVGGLTLIRDTNPATANIGAGPAGTGPATKTYVDAKILLSPPTATNAVNGPHVVTASVYQDDGLTAAQGGDGVTGFAPAPNGTTVTFALTNSNGATATFSGGNTAVVSGGMASVTINSATAGLVTLNASTNFSVGGQSLTRDTDPVTSNITAGPGGSGPVTKTYVDARIILKPATATNAVTDPHVVTATVEQDDGLTAAQGGDGVTGFAPAPDGTVVTFALTNSGGSTAAFVGSNVAVVNGGTASATINSSTAGVVTLNASATFSVSGQSLTRDTDGSTPAPAGPGGSGPAVKNYVDASIAITPSTATNEVGSAHTFTIAVTAFPAGATPVSFATPTVSFVGSAPGTVGAVTPVSVVGNVATYSLTINSSSAGTFTINAADSVTMGGVTVTRDTDSATVPVSGPGGSGSAVKNYVDASIAITPSGINPVGSAHTFTITVSAIPAGATPVSISTPTVTFSPLPSSVGPVTFVSLAGNVATYSVTINSNVAGTFTANASDTITMGSVTVTRDTDGSTPAPSGPGGSGPAIKTYVTPGIDIEKTTNGPTNANPTAPDYDNEDAVNGPGVPVLTPGTAVTWTYKVTNTGQLPYTVSQVVVTDDNGTPLNTADDFVPTRVLSSDVGNDGILSPGEVWLYTATGTVLTLPNSSSGTPVTFDFSGSSALDGTDGNIRTFTAGGVSVKASAFSRDKSTGAWSAAWLGSYGGGLGVTDSSEGDGSNNAHTVDNIGRDNYVLLEFDRDVILDAAFLGYVVGDSDIKVWIGTRTDAFNTHTALSDSVLAGLGFSETNLTDLSSTRTADFNAGNIAGNVVVFAADPGDTTPDDQFKIGTAKLAPTTRSTYENKATVTAGGLSDSDLSHYSNPTLTPRIDIEKTTNGTTNTNPIAPDYDNEDAANGAGVPILTPGSTVTWTYKVTNTGTTIFTSDQVVVSDDNGTPSNTADDLSTTNGKISFLSVQTGDTDTLLEPGEVWLYKATGIVQTLTGTTPGAATTFDFSGSSSINGTAGNVRTFTQGSISVKGSAFSRDKSTGAWATAYLGSYGGGLGVTDGSEDGTNDTHTIDNVGRDNYVLLRFSESVIVDSTFLGYVVNDSDLKIWIGTISNAFNTTVNLSDATLASLGFSEVNLTDLTTTRTADLNAGNVQGNVLVIAADPGDDTPEDRFKVELLTTRTPTGGVYENKGTVTVPGDDDSDLSHYKNPSAPPPAIDIEKYVREVGISGGGEGLTPGYWKQTQHFSSWIGYTQTQSFNTVFGVNNPNSPTLLQALQTGGGGFDALDRHAVAALLNASNPNISYAYSVSQVIAKVQYAYANPSQVETIKNQFAVENEKGADLSNGGGTSVDGPNIDADTTPGLIVQTGNQVAFTYYVKNPGSVALTNVVVMDDNQTPGNLSDDFQVTAVLSSGYNVGDTDKDNQLDVNETWQYTYGPIVVTEGQHTNIGRVTGTPVGGGSNVTDSDAANWLGISDKDGSISGTKWRDVTGNGASSDDVPLAGVVIYLDLDNDGVKETGEPWTTTAADGTYKFTGIAVGNYTVREVLPTNMLRTGPALSDNYAVSVSTGEAETGNDFTNFEKCLDCDLTNVFYTITRGSSSFNVTDLRGNTNQGDVVTVTFTVPAGGVEQFSLVSYTAPDAYFDANRASLQKIFEGQTGFFMPGTHTMAVGLPSSNYQVDFVCGSIINQLGPANSNIFYTPQGRLISADNDGYNTGSANFQGVTLVVGGSANADDLRFNVATDPTKISVVVNNVEAGQVSFGAGSGVTITQLAGVGYAGNDAIKVSTTISLMAVLRGGSGNDTLTGGAGSDIIFGDSGCDTITGNAGRDLLIGGTEADVIHGNVDDDILIGGTTNYDANTYANMSALESIMSEWVRTDRTFAQRVYNISYGTSGTSTDSTYFSSRLNGSSYLLVKNTGRNVFDDNVADTLYGDENSDWLLTNNDEGTQNDAYYTGERITDID